MSAGAADGAPRPTTRYRSSCGSPKGAEQAASGLRRTLPMGTVVMVTNLMTGLSANCTVADRGPFIRGRIIDLDRSVFMAIAESPGQGVVQVRIEW